MPTIYPRYIKKRIVEALHDTPVVAINGPRQCSKSTLAKQFVDDGRTYYTLDLLDTGVACRSLNATPDSLKADRELLGHLLETFVFCELKKQASWAERDIKFFFYRDKDQYEVDLILESDGQFLAIEIKAAATVRKTDFAGIERFARKVNAGFAGGIVLYDGDHALPFEEKLTAVPIGYLWG